MTIENALLKSAEANENLAAAMNRYADVMAAAIEGGVSVPAATAAEPAVDTKAAKAPTAAEKKAAAAAAKKAEKEAADAAAAAAEAEDEDDGLGDEDDAFADVEDTKTYTTADIRELILKVRDIGGEKKNAAGAKKVLATLGVKSMSEISEDMYGKAADLCLKALK